MKNIILAIALVFGMSSFCIAADNNVYVKTPAKVEIDAGRIKQLSIETNAKKVIWLLTDKNADLIKLSDTNAIFSSPVAGTYTLYLFVAEGDEPKGPYTISIVVKGDLPNPGPGPVPVDDFVKSLREAYASDTSTDKVKYRDLLIGVYKDAIDNILTDPEIETVGQVVTLLSMNGREVLGENNLVPLRKLISVEFKKITPTDINTKLDNTQKNTYKVFFQKVISALEKV